MKKPDRNQTLRRQRHADTRKVLELKRAEAARLRRMQSQKIGGGPITELIEKQWGYKETHHLIEERVPPPSMIRLRNELAKHPDIYKQASESNTIEDCLGIIAARLDIVLDGLYDVPDLCDLLCRALEQRGQHGNRPHLLDSRLINAELVEREGEISLEEGEGTIAPKSPGSIESIMEQAGCAVCENIAACRMEGKCLRSSALEVGVVI